ncbi:P-loop NTPase [Clostridium lundense]|uniref:nucleotide-binding protein n=1 Tax=Clostridium lundense TaxID=319475 RepID=UPI0004827130|nr:nitrogenase iron protein NifH [Clostridium lundense]
MLNKECLKIAFYGKGGIGKSTIASNLSAAFATLGMKVLHIGCDPKGDSTRTLMGYKIPTLLNILEKDTPIYEEDFLFKGYKNVHCIEAGGPKPGMGCAGRGIITVIEELTDFKIFDKQWDVIIYDVLGDVVCGGFSTPIREKLIDAVYIVTSSEFMSIYAANNIMKSINTFSSMNGALLGGIIHNCRSSNSNIEIVQKFSKDCNTSILDTIPYSKNLGVSELKAKTVVENLPNSPVSYSFIQLAKKIINNKDYHIPNSLDDNLMEKLSESILKEITKE